MTGSLTQHQLQLFHAIKLAAIPKDDYESRIIMMFGVHAKIVFSIFASSTLKRDVQMRNFTHQYGTKNSGAETMIHMFQQTIIQKPNFEFFSQMLSKLFIILIEI